MMRTMRYQLFALAAACAMFAAPIAFGADNPCNPCGAKAKNPCNPCGAKAAMPAVNPCFAKAGKVFYVNDPMKRNTVTFTSEAPLEDIVGTTNEVAGYIVFDPKKPGGSVRGEFSVPVSSLDTGIPLRNEHLHSEQWLNAAKNPHITYKVTGSELISTYKDTPEFQTHDIMTTGDFTLNGQTRKMKIPVRVTHLVESEATKQKMPGNLVAARARFDVPLASFAVTAPQGSGLIGSKVSSSINVEVRLTGSDTMQMAGNPCNPCNPCSGKAANPCNPCGAKAKNPCNPCNAKATNPCNPCNAKAVKQSDAGDKAKKQRTPRRASTRSAGSSTK